MNLDEKDQLKPDNAPRPKKTNLAKVMSKARFGDGEFDLGVLLAKVPPKSVVFEGEHSYLGNCVFDDISLSGYHFEKKVF